MGNSGAGEARGWPWGHVEQPGGQTSRCAVPIGRRHKTGGISRFVARADRGTVIVIPTTVSGRKPRVSFGTIDGEKQSFVNPLLTVECGPTGLCLVRNKKSPQQAAGYWGS